MYPPIDVFGDIADPADWELIAAAEAKTNPRVRDEIGAIQLVPPERHVAGPGANWAMAPFCHLSRDRPSRFSDGSYGVYYAGDRFEVALAEAVFHFERFIAATGTGVGWLRSPSRYGNGSRAKRGLSAESDRDYR